MPHDLVWWLNTVGNVSIALGYMAMPALVLPYLPVTRRVLVFGAAFFALCGLTHAGMALGHAPAMGHSPFWAVEHAAQAVATWGFILSFHVLLRGATRRRAARESAAALRRGGEPTGTGAAL